MFVILARFEKKLGFMKWGFDEEIKDMVFFKGWGIRFLCFLLFLLQKGFFYVYI